MISLRWLAIYTSVCVFGITCLWLWCLVCGVIWRKMCYKGVRTFNAFLSRDSSITRYFIFYVFPEIIFSLWLSFACPNAFFSIIVFSYWYSEFSVIFRSGERIFAALNLLWWWYSWRRVKFNAVPLDLRWIILGVDQHVTMVNVELSLYENAFFDAFFRCDNRVLSSV